MKKQDVLCQVQDIFRDVLCNDEIILTNETTANDIDEWDSLSQVVLLAEIQNKYGIRFKAADTIRWSNVGEMIDTILKLVD